VKYLWCLPVAAFLASVAGGALSKWVFELQRGAFLWDMSLILLSASVFGTAGYIIGWAIWAPQDGNGEE